MTDPGRFRDASPGGGGRLPTHTISHDHPERVHAVIPILTTESTLLCPHGGNVILTTSNAEARVDGVPVLLLTDVHSVVGCPFEVGSEPRPSVTIRWLVGAIWTRVDGTPALLQNSVGLCYTAEDVPQGAPRGGPGPADGAGGVRGR